MGHLPILLAVTLLLVAPSRVTTNPIFEEDGVLIRQTGDIRRVGAAWVVLVTIQPPSPLSVTQLDRDLDGVFTLAEKRFGEDGVMIWRRRWTVLRSMLAQEVARLSPTPATIEDQVAFQRRVERALLGFVGTIFRPLFNIPDFTDIKALQDLILKNKHQQSAVQHHVAEMVTWINATRSLVRQNAAHIMQVQRQTREAFLNFNRTQKELEEQHELMAAVTVSRTIDNALHDVELAISNHVDSLKHFHLQKLDLERGWLTENIIEISQLQNCLRHVKRKGYSVLNLEWYYQHVAVTPLWQEDDHLAFRAVLPAVDDEMYFGYSLIRISVIYYWNNRTTEQPMTEPINQKTSLVDQKTL